jgi:hypothetical protein
MSSATGRDARHGVERELRRRLDYRYREIVRVLEGGKMVYLWGFRQKEVYGLILTPYRGRPRK